MSANPVVDQRGETIPPLDFFVRDAIHPDNQKLIEQEQQRYRLLKRGERLRLGRYVNSLRRDLRRAGYNQLLIERADLWDEYQQMRRDLQTITFINDEARRAAARRWRAMRQRGKALNAQIADLRETYERYAHYSGWLAYEKDNRRALQADAKREKDIRKGMRKESKWLEQLLLDVFRKTPGCHHIFSKDGKEITKIPKFERVVIEPDAHWFWLAASRRMIFGWRWLLPYGVSVNNLTDERTLENMRAATKRQVDAIWTQTGQLIFRVSRLDSPDALPKLVMWRDSLPYFPETRRAKFPYSIGISEGRKFQWLDLASDPHILIAGKSQSGKSNLTNAIIAYFASEYSPAEIRFVLIDGKMKVEFSHWRDLPHLLWDIAGQMEEIETYLERVIALMRKRLDMLTQAQTKDIAAYNARVDKEDHLARVVCVIDEMNFFVGQGALTEKIHNQIMLLTSQGRAAGVHVIAATQYPEVKVIPGRVKVNMSVRVCFPVPTVTASMIVLDTPAAARLPNVPGRNAVAIGMKEFTVQAPRIEDSDIAHVVSTARQRYPDIGDDLPENKDAPRITVWDEARALRAALEWTDGKLSGQQIHKMLGEESPGERHLNVLMKHITDQAQAVGYVESDGQTYRVIKRKKAYYLEQYDNTTNTTE